MAFIFVFGNILPIMLGLTVLKIEIDSTVLILTSVWLSIPEYKCKPVYKNTDVY